MNSARRALNLILIVVFSADDDDKQREAIATVQPVVNKEKKKHKLDPKMIERLINTLALSTIVDMDHFFEEKDTKCVKVLY